MSKEKGEESTKSLQHQAISEPTTTIPAQSEQETTSVSTTAETVTTTTTSQFAAALSPTGLAGAELGPHHVVDDDVEEEEYEERKATALGGEYSASQQSPEEMQASAIRPRQVIAVSASKGPAAFFNLARKFLVTDETCDLSALEGAIVSAVDAAHLLERSKLADIVRIQTSYVTVEPKRRKQTPAPQGSAAGVEAGSSLGGGTSSLIEDVQTLVSPSSTGPESQARRTSSGRELRRARIVITVRRTASYKKWLDENPLQAIIAGDAEEDAAVDSPDVES